VDGRGVVDDLRDPTGVVAWWSRYIERAAGPDITAAESPLVNSAVYFGMRPVVPTAARRPRRSRKE
jgi:hypothetical protein